MPNNEAFRRLKDASDEALKQNFRRLKEASEESLRQAKEASEEALRQSKVVLDEVLILIDTKHREEVAEAERQCQKNLKEALRQAEVRHQEELHRKDKFLAMLSHELRNPLAVIVNGIQLLQATSGQCPNDKSNCLGIQSCSDGCSAACLAKQTGLCGDIQAMILRQGRHLTHLVDDLLDVSRASRGNITLRRKVIDFNEAIMMGVEQTRHLLDEKKHRLEMRLSHEPVKVFGDFTRLNQVVANLLNNACKYTPAGGEITVTSKVEGGMAVVSVKDNGNGITSDQIEYIFDLFFQVDNTLDRTAGGLGLGLTLVRSLMNLHDGEVRAYSGGVGQGSEFVLTMAVSTGHIAGPDYRREVAKMATTIRSILVVDDIAEAANYMASLLKVQGHKVWVANSGAQAIQMVEEHRPRIVLLDIGMPSMDGYECARLIREKFGNDVSLVALTGYGCEDDKQYASEVGFNHYLTKPVELPQLAEILK